jgi:hypothetical protein
LPGTVKKQPISSAGSRLIVDGHEHIIGEDGDLPSKSGLLVIVEDYPRTFYLAAPQAGPKAAGGDDAATLAILAATAHKHVIELTVPGCISGAYSRVVFEGLGGYIKFIAARALWFPIEIRGVTLG